MDPEGWSYPANPVAITQRPPVGKVPTYNHYQSLEGLAEAEGDMEMDPQASPQEVQQAQRRYVCQTQRQARQKATSGDVGSLEEGTIGKNYSKRSGPRGSGPRADPAPAGALERPKRRSGKKEKLISSERLQEPRRPRSGEKGPASADPSQRFGQGRLGARASSSGAELLQRSIPPRSGVEEEPAMVEQFQRPGGRRSRNGWGWDRAYCPPGSGVEEGRESNQVDPFRGGDPSQRLSPVSGPTGRYGESTRPAAPEESLADQLDESPPPDRPRRLPRKRYSKGAPNDTCERNELPRIGALEKPHKSSYFLPGKMERQDLLFLIDTGCNTNLLSKKMFDQMPARIRDQLEENDRYGLMADGSKLQFYGLIRLTGRVRDVPIEENFIVSQISKDAILGMPFLISHRCHMDFDQPVISIGDRRLSCTDRYGRLMVSKVHTWKKVTIPPLSEVTVAGRISARNYVPVGIIEGADPHLPVARSLNQPGDQGDVAVQCLNPGNHPIELAAGQVIGLYTAIRAEDVQAEPWTEPKDFNTEVTGVGCTAVYAGEAVPEHLVELYDQAVQG